MNELPIAVFVVAASLAFMFLLFSLGYSMGVKDATEKCNDTLAEIDIKLNEMVKEFDENERRRRRADSTGGKGLW